MALARPAQKSAHVNRPPPEGAARAAAERQKKLVRFGDYHGAITARQHRVSYNEVVRQPVRSQLRALDLYRLLAPYIGVRLLDQIRAVVPLAAFLALFLAAVLRSPVPEAFGIALGLAAAIIGLMLFMEGITHGLMPFSESIGYHLPGSARVPAILGAALVLGAAATFAEPAIGALKAAGSLADRARTPLLHALLNEHAAKLVLAVALGVGVAVLLGVLRVVMNWRLKNLVILTLVPCLGLTAYLAVSPAHREILGLAWDCGAITTGPVTVPLVVALGIGVAAAAGREDNPLAGFGIVTLASLLPIMAVMLLALGLAAPDAAIAPPPGSSAAPAWHDESPSADVLAALRAVVPLVVLLWLIQSQWLRRALPNRRLIVYGIILCVLGMALFNMGLAFGLTPLGKEAGGLLPAAFTAREDVPGSPLYPELAGFAVVLLFAALLGFGATVAEPALNAMGMTVENLTDGAFPRATLVRAVAVGVSLGTLTGVMKVLFAIPIAALLLPAYALALVLTVLAREEYVNLAWDSAGVTTGPVTVPLVLAMGLGLGHAVDAAEGFGILALASVGPILSVLCVGLWIRARIAISHRQTGEGQA